MDTQLLANVLGADDVVSPTIPYTPPAGATTPVVTTTTGATISLQSNVVQVKKGEKAKIAVVVYTNNQEIKEFSFQITFNPQYFKVVDANSVLTGVQLPYSNTFFAENINNVDNASGIINFTAKATSGTATLTNRIILEFEVESLVEGASEFKLIKNNSKLITSNNVDILGNVNAVNVQVASGTIFTSPTVRPTLLGGGTKVPDTAIGDDIGSFTTIVLGGFLMVLGFYLLKKKQDHDLHR